MARPGVRKTQAFAGGRITDFSQIFSGPFATRQLGLLGADVIGGR
jgi:crotonobetainyl-CoA:carnitine CoA-transferase CaiB-like acyl-CoA transferase